MSTTTNQNNGNGNSYAFYVFAFILCVLIIGQCSDLKAQSPLLDSNVRAGSRFQYRFVDCSYKFTVTDSVCCPIKGRIWLCTQTYTKGKNRWCNSTVVRAATKEKALVIYKRALNSWPQYHNSIKETKINISEITDQTIYTEQTIFLNPKK